MRPFSLMSHVSWRSAGATFPLVLLCFNRHYSPLPVLDPFGGSHREAQLKAVCDVIYRSSTAREALCQAIHEPSAEIALRHLGEFSDDPGVWRRTDWADAFLSDGASLTTQVDLVLERLGQWYAVRKAPRKVVMEEPWDWFPRARLTRRSFVFHYGPTNSGKTHAALEALVAAKSGVYCAPLKALAGQVWSRVNAAVPCDLLIGDERRFGGGAEHVSCTVEMTPIDLQVDVGVIDEIQMIGDRDRGWAWTRALLGLPAREIHLCGEERTIPLIQEILYKTFEKGRLTLREHKRLVPLSPSEPLHGNLANVENGDCVVCFSRKAVLDIQSQLRAVPGVRPSCIYGAMPFDVREKQAEIFNIGAHRGIIVRGGGAPDTASSPASVGAGAAKPSSKHVLVSTDAIAYGLNMNIERIVFTTMQKFDGKAMVDIPAPIIKQICGRAGRFGLLRQNPEGRYTSLHDGSDHDKLVTAMKSDVSILSRAGLLPTSDILQLYVELEERKQKSGGGPDGELSFHQLMRRFADACHTTGLFFPCDMTRSLVKISQLLEAVPELTLRDRILFCYLPMSESSRESAELIAGYARDHAAGRAVELRVDGKYARLLSSRHYRTLADTIEHGGPTGGDAHFEGERQRTLSQLEPIYRQAEMYCWLSWRFQLTFTQRDEGTALKHRVSQAMEKLVPST